MNQITFHQSDLKWQQTPKVDGRRLNLKGIAYLDNQASSVTILEDALFSTPSTDTLTALLKRMNGFYAWVEETSEGLRAGVDHIRSYPLFYAVHNGDLLLSEDAEWVRQQIDDNKMDPIAREEFMLAGYVTGSDTLYPNVKQLQAGEYLEAYFGTNGIILKTVRYYRFWHTEPVKFDEAQLREKLKRVTLEAMSRLIEQAAGRQIVIPLSGGYDSRLIASMLKRLGYRNVLCFTYGIPGNKEAQYSRKVAESLGFEWLFIEYSEEIWRNAWGANDAAQYMKMAANHVSLPHVQDWLAIKRLIENKLIESDALIAAGHSGDFVAGSHIPSFVFTTNSLTQNDLIDSIEGNHLSNAPKSGMTLKKKQIYITRLTSTLPFKVDGTASGFANLYELWDWQERQSKYIVNSTRVYDYFGITWWLPLWDTEFVRFWECVPLSLRKNREWYKNWVAGIYASETKLLTKGLILDNAEDPSIITIQLRRLAAILPNRFLEIIKRYQRIYMPTRHPLGFEGLLPKNSYAKYLNMGYNTIGAFSDLFIKSKWGKS